MMIMASFSGTRTSVSWRMGVSHFHITLPLLCVTLFPPEDASIYFYTSDTCTSWAASVPFCNKEASDNIYQVDLVHILGL